MRANKLSICFITSEFPPYSGGIGTYVWETAKLLADRGSSVVVVTKEENIVNNDWARIPNVMYWGIRGGILGKISRELDFALKAALVVNSRYSDFDLIEVPDYLAQGIFVRKSKLICRLHTPLALVQELDDNRNIYRFQKVFCWLEKLQIKTARFLTSPSHALAEWIENKWLIQKNKVTVYPNPISLRSNIADRRTFRFKYGLFMGRIEKRKGLTMMLEVLPQVLINNKKIHFVFMGQDTTYRGKSAIDLIKEACGTQVDRLHFIGFKTGVEKDRIIKKAEFILFPSIWENFPYVVLESLMMGKLVLASNVGGLPELLGKVGVLMSCKQEWIDYLSNDGYLRDISATKSYQQFNKFTSNRLARTIINYYLACKEHVNNN